MLRSDQTRKIMLFVFGSVAGVMASAAIYMAMSLDTTDRASLIRRGAMFGNMQTLQGSEQRQSMESVVAELRQFPKDRLGKELNTPDRPALESDPKTSPNENQLPSKESSSQNPEGQGSFSDLLQLAGDGARKAIESEVGGLTSKLDATGAAIASMVKDKTQEMEQLLAKAQAEAAQAKAELAKTQAELAGEKAKRAQAAQAAGSEVKQEKQTEQQPPKAPERDGFSDMLQQAGNGMRKAVEAEVSGLTGTLNAASAATGAALGNVGVIPAAGAPLENFHPDPPQKAKAASPTDCRDNKPQTFNASFMVAPPLPPVQPCKVLVNLMTTFIDNADPTKTVAQDNMLRAFKRLRAHGIRSWLFTENEKWAKKARDNGVEVVARFRKNNANTPCLKFMYQYVIANDGCASTERRVVFDGYVNGDILFGTDFVRTLTKIGEVFAPRIGTGTGRGVMVIGMRFNKNIQESTVIDTEEKLVEFSKSATPFQPDAQDYFIFSRGGVDWTKEIAHFVVGRPAYDNWLVNHAHHAKHLDLVDASQTVRALHQTCRDGNHAGHRPNLDKSFNNHALNPQTGKGVGPHEWDHGIFKWAHFETKSANGQIEVKARGQTQTGGPRALPTK